MSYRDDSYELDLRKYWGVIWHRWWIISLCAVLAAASAFLWSKRQLPTYQSTVTLEVERVSDLYEQPYQAIISAEAIAGTYALELTSPKVVEEVVRRLEHLGLDVGEVRGLLNAQHMQETSLIELSVQHTDPRMAQILARTAAQVFIDQKTIQQQARYQDSLDELEMLIEKLENSIAETRAQMMDLETADSLSAYERAEMVRLESQLRNDQTRLNILLSSVEQFRLAMVRYGTHVTVFAPAELPREPVGPQVMRNTALATVTGGMSGIGAVFLLEYLDDRVHGPKDVQRELGINTLGTLPILKERDKSWVAVERPLSLTTEAFRSLRTSIQFTNLDASVQTLLVTSPLPSEGKSYTAVNLATVMAQAGQSVLLLDADLRHPTVHDMLGVEKEPGLSDTMLALSMRNDITFSAKKMRDFTKPTRLSKLSVLPGGTYVRTPAELLGSQLFQAFLDSLCEGWDMVIIDSPPVMAVTDPVIVSTMVDGVALVVDAGASRIPVVTQALDRLDEVNANILGVVINKMPERTADQYCQYYKYYKNYYEDAKVVEEWKPFSGEFRSWSIRGGRRFGSEDDTDDL